MTSKSLTSLADTTLPAPATARATNTEPLYVEFMSSGERVRGNLFLPQGARACQAAPAVVVTGAWMTVKEQMAGRYAREMARRGFVSLVFDFRGWGESDGECRQFEDPAAKIADIKAAVAYLATRPEIDPQRIGGLGVCASAGYMVTAAATTPALHSVALVAPWLHDRDIVRKAYGGQAVVDTLMQAGDAAETAYRRTGVQAFVPAASLSDSTAIMYGAPYYTEEGRGQIGAWRNQADPAFWRGWLTFDAMAAVPAVKQPFLMVHSEAAAIPEGARQFYAALGPPKTERWLENVSQFDFYDRDQPVAAAADAVAKHFRRTMKKPTTLAAGSSEAAKVISVVSSIPLAVDLARYDLAESAFASRVEVDYTSLWGGTPSHMTPAELMTAWRGVVPGFEGTHHELSNMVADVDGKRATASAAVDGRHWLDGKLWRPIGHYYWDLTLQDGQWKVDRMEFDMTEEIGDRNLSALAMERVKAMAMQ